jgi:hypothetical protein
VWKDSTRCTPAVLAGGGGGGCAACDVDCSPLSWYCKAPVDAVQWIVNSGVAMAWCHEGMRQPLAVLLARCCVASHA